MDKPESAEIIKALTMEIERLKETQKYKSVNSVRTINQLYSTIETLKSDHARDLLVIEESHIIKIFGIDPCSQRTRICIANHSTKPRRVESNININFIIRLR